MIHHANYFYADEDLVASTDTIWLQGEFDNLTGLFTRVGIWTNSGWMVGMLCHPCRVVGNQCEVAYERRMTGEGPI